MASISKRVSSSWVSGNYGIMKTATDTLSLPATIYADGTAATIGLKGNTVQNGTPTPQNPVDVVGVGERTGNLFVSEWEQGSIDTSGTDYPSYTVVRTKNYIPVTPNTIYSISRNIATSYINLRFYNGNKQYIDRGTSSTIRLISGNSEANPMAANMGFCCFEIIDTNIRYMRVNDNSNNVTTQYMMVEGQYTASTIPAYEPYGIKIPISSANITTPVYLGEVQTTRKVKKLVLTGEESFELHSSIANLFTLTTVTDYLFEEKVITMCTHYRGGVNTGATSAVDGTVRFYYGSSAQARIFYVKDTNFNTAADFKAYLAAQYANGTPVTIWYVLAEPTTGIVNEPLMKIGDYADEVPNVSIPVTAGGDTISVGTTVQPSEVTANYHGWHTGAVHERESDQWD